MPVNITDVDEFTDPVTAPAGADAANAASVNQIAQKLANRTRNLHTRLSVIEPSFDGGIVVYDPPLETRRTLSLAAGMPLSDAFEFVGTSSIYAWRSLAQGEILFPINAQVAPVSLDGATTHDELVIDSVSVFLKPGAARGLGPPNDRMQVWLISQTVTGSTPVVSTHAAESDAGTDVWQTVTATPGATVTMDQLRDYYVLVISGNNSDTNKDLIARVRVTVTRAHQPL